MSLTDIDDTKDFKPLFTAIMRLQVECQRLGLARPTAIMWADPRTPHVIAMNLPAELYPSWGPDPYEVCSVDGTGIRLDPAKPSAEVRKR